MWRRIQAIVPVLVPVLAVFGLAAVIAPVQVMRQAQQAQEVRATHYAQQQERSRERTEIRADHELAELRFERDQALQQRDAATARADQQQQRADEHQVIDTRQDVLDAEREIRSHDLERARPLWNGDGRRIPSQA